MLGMIGKIYGEVYSVATFAPAHTPAPAEPPTSGETPHGLASLRRQPRTQWGEPMAPDLLAQACPVFPHLGKT